MSNLSNDYVPTRSGGIITRTSDRDQIQVLITFNDGARFQYEISIPSQIDPHQTQRDRDIELQIWYTSHNFMVAYELSHSGHNSETCVSLVPTYINMRNVSQICEISS